MATDYEKKYKEALERAKKMMKSKRKVVVEKQALETIFPELAESEDERIRKELVEAFEALDIDSSWNGIPVKSILAWLEKQKENPKSADSIPSDYTSDVKCEDRWHKVTDSLPDNGRLVLAKDCLGNVLLARYDGEGWDVSVYDDEDYRCHNGISKWCEIHSEKQKEQKSAEWDKLQEDFRNINEAFEDGKKEVVAHPEKYDLCKPAEWSEEDRKHLNSVLLSLNRPFYNMNEQEKSDFDWLHELPERFNLQPKPEVECDNETEIQKAYREGKNAGRKEVFDHPEEYGLQPRRMYDYETGKRNPEWSKEDERILKGIIGKIDHDQTYGVSKVEMLSFLEDLRPSLKPSEVCYGPKGDPDPAGVWKPSEEQMEALLSTLHPDDPYYCELRSLYKQLKQL